MTTVADLNLPYSKAQLKRTRAVRFTILSSEELERYSVAEVFEENTYGEGGKPNHNGVNDPRFGPIDLDAVCETCNSDMEMCPGHFGHIKL
jgi:DNA-directed RNA polymerase beta' subunit